MSLLPKIYYNYDKELEILFESNNFDEIEYLLNNGLNVNSLNGVGDNALFYADLEKSKFLVKHGININNKNYYYQNVLYSNEYKAQTVDKLTFLLENGLDYSRINNIKEIPVSFNQNIEVIEFFVNKLNFNINNKYEDLPNTLCNVNVEVAEYLVKNGINFTDIDKYGQNVLCKTKIDTLKYLISLGANINNVSNDGKNLLFFNDRDCLEHLISLGLDSNITDFNGNNILYYCSSDSKDYIINNLKIDPFHINNDGENLLFNSHLENIEGFIKIGLYPYKINNYGNSLLCKNSNNVHYWVNHFNFKENIPRKNLINDCFSTESFDFENNIRLIEYVVKDEKNLNILDVKTKNNLLLYHISNPEITKFLINKGIKLDHINSQKEHFLSLNNDVDNHHLAINKGLLKDKNYLNLIQNNLFFNIYKFSGKPELYKELKKIPIDYSSFSDTKNSLLFYDFPPHKIKEILKYTNINEVDYKNSNAISRIAYFSNNLKRFIALTNNGIDLNLNQKDTLLSLHSLFDKYLFNKNNPNETKLVIKFINYIILHGFRMDSLTNSFSVMETIALILNKMKEPEIILNTYFKNIKELPVPNYTRYSQAIEFLKLFDFSNLNNINIFKILHLFLDNYSSKYIYPENDLNKNLNGKDINHYISQCWNIIKKDKETFITYLKYINNVTFMNENLNYFTALSFYALKYNDTFILNFIKDFHLHVFLYSKEDLQSFPFISEKIIKCGYNVNLVNFNNENTLFHSYDYDSLKYCLEHNINKNLISNSGDSCLSYRIIEYFEQVIDRRKKHKIDDDIEQKNILLLVDHNIIIPKDNNYGINIIDYLNNVKSIFTLPNISDKDAKKYLDFAELLLIKIDSRTISKLFNNSDSKQSKKRL